MSPLAAKPVLHGRDHCPGGADPIPCLGSSAGGGVVYSDYVQSFSSLIGYWRLGETAEPWLDSSVYDNHMALHDGTTNLTADVAGGLPAGQDDGAVQLNYTGTGGSSSADHLLTGPPEPVTSLYQLGEMTVAAFVKVNAYPGATSRGQVFGSMAWAVGGYYDGWAVQITPAGTIRFTLGGPTEKYVDSPGPLVLDSWYHVAASYDQANIRLYLNGTLVATTAYATTFVAGQTDGIRVGFLDISGNNLWFNGSVDEIAVWDDSLTADEIADIASAVDATENAGAGTVSTADGAGGTSWAYPTVKVDGTRYDEILSGTGLSSTDNTDGTVTLSAAGGSPAADTQVWMPLTTVVSSVPELVWDASNSLIPTLTPI